MDIEASTTLIAKRLQKLKQWQAEQEEKLLRQQQIQRETLSNKQVRICQAFGLPTHDFVDAIENMEDTCVIYEVETNSEETTVNGLVSQYNTKISDGALEIIKEEIPMNVSHESYERKRIEEEPDCTSLNTNENINYKGNYTSDTLSQSRELNTDLLIEEIKLLPLDNATSNGCILIDDIPVSSTKKDFQTLLEERLKKESEVTPITQIENWETNIKKPFLRKGQGLSRFKMSVNSQSRLITKKHNASLNTRCIDGSDKKKVHKTTYSGSSNDASLSSGTQQLSLKSVPLPRKKIYKMSKSIAPVKRAMHQANASDFDLRAERELEEVRIFELLEEKAENSSFCSTSSAVLAFLQQSTPFKIKGKPNYEDKDDVTNTKQQIDKVERESVEQHAHNIMSKPNVQHSRTCSDGVDSYMNTVVVDDMPKEIWNSVNQIAQGTQTTCLGNQNTSSRRVFTVSLSDNNDEEEISMRDNRNIAHDSNTDVSHRVRFAKHNEYRTIDLINVSNASNKSTLENYLEQKDWNNRSNNTSESSSDEEKLPLTYDEHESSLKIIANEKAIDASIRLSLQRDNATRDSYYRVSTMKASSVSEEEASNCKEKLLGEKAHDDNEICASIIEEIVETSDEEQSILSSSSSSSSLSLSSSIRQGLCMHEKKEYALENKSEKMDRIEIHSNAEAVKHCSYEDETNQTNTFRPELLKCRLLELEKEIDIFRKESSALLQQRRKLQEDQTMLHKEYAEREKKFEEIKRRVQNQLEEEKKRLARERVAMENRIRDAQEKMRQNKVERHKAQDLQEQLEKLKDELNIKESRWNAAESRYKSELRTLRVEIAKLKQEIMNLQNVKRTNARNVMKSGGQAIAKAINQINKRISATSQFKEISAKTSRALSNSSDISDHDNDNDDNDNDDKNKEKKKTNISVKKGESEFEIGLQSKRDEKFAKRNIANKKRNLYENLLKDATSDLIEYQDSFYITRNIDKSCQSSLTDSIVEQIQNLNAKSNDDFTNEDLEYATSYMKHRTDGRLCQANHSRDTNNEIQVQKNGEPSCEKVNSNSILRHSSYRTNNGTKRSNKDVKQIQHPDGYIEYWYPNGNVKKIFPDQGITKMIYYNGDVRETDRDGRVKYFYATTRTSHITTPDGLEILEFSNGQIEKHTSDGTIQVSFPDGATRIAQTDGTEKWILPDGTVAQTFTNGDKILILPNGQREIHTKEHKRREYPDGTIKLIYPDGKQETRYSNGRKRLKDKDGNLLMDS